MFFNTSGGVCADTPTACLHRQSTHLLGAKEARQGLVSATFSFESLHTDLSRLQTSLGFAIGGRGLGERICARRGRDLGMLICRAGATLDTPAVRRPWERCWNVVVVVSAGVEAAWSDGLWRWEQVSGAEGKHRGTPKGQQKGRKK